LQSYLGVDEDTKRRMLDILRCGREVEHSQQSLNHAIHTITVRTAIAAVEWLKASSPDRHPTFQLVLQWCLNVTDFTEVGEDIKDKCLTEAVRMTIRAREGYQEWMQEVQEFKVNAWTDIHPQILAMIEGTNAAKEGLRNKTQELADAEQKIETLQRKNEELMEQNTKLLEHVRREKEINANHKSTKNHLESCLAKKNKKIRELTKRAEQAEPELGEQKLTNQVSMEMVQTLMRENDSLREALGSDVVEVPDSSPAPVPPSTPSSPFDEDWGDF
jgi:septal ring factor EnvC (AmiA/AmiB activator)